VSLLSSIVIHAHIQEKRGFEILVSSTIASKRSCSVPCETEKCAWRHFHVRNREVPYICNTTGVCPSLVTPFAFVLPNSALYSLQLHLWKA